MSDPLLTRAAEIIRREADQLAMNEYTDTDPITGQVVWENEDVHADVDEMLAIAAQLEARAGGEGK